MNNPPPTSFTQRLPYWLLFLTATVGVPGAAAIAFAEQLSQRPLLALGVAVLYEIVVFVVGFSAKVWQKMESDLVDRTAAHLDEALQRLFSGYRKRYLKLVFYSHRDFDVKGLSTQGIYTPMLEQVFVELSISPRAPHLISADPIQTVPDELQKGRFSVWDFLNAQQMAGQSLAIIGAPGSGKTTLLKHIALTLAAGKERRQPVQAPDKLPILLYLRDHAADIKGNPDLTLDQALRTTLDKWNLSAPAGWFEQQLKQGRCLIMLDGLDEVADPAARQGVVAWVERQMQLFNQNRFVITSRPHGYHSNPLAGVTVLTILPFTRAQVERFVHNWYTANEIMSQQKDDTGVRMAAQEGAEDLLRRLRNTPALSDLAVNPLLLTVIATVHRYRSSLPGRRVELYSEICEVFLGKRQQARGLELDLTPAQKQRVLQPLAYHLMSQAKREIAVADAQAVIAEALALVSPQTGATAFLKMIENSSGLLVERERGVYSFSHLTFQEYLAAVHIQEQRLEGELTTRVAEPWWHETIRLYAAQTDASPIITACLCDDPPALPALILAVECQEEARELQPELRAKLDAILDQGVEDPNSERRRMVAEALLALRLRRMTRIDDDTYVDSSLVIHAEYQLFLDEKRAASEYFQPDHWQSHQFPAGKGRKPVVGVRSSDAIAFCQWLTQRKESDWHFRMPESGECTDVCSDQVGGSWWASSGIVPPSEIPGETDSITVISGDTLAQYVDSTMIAGNLERVLRECLSLSVLTPKLRTRPEPEPFALLDELLNRFRRLRFRGTHEGLVRFIQLFDYSRVRATLLKQVPLAPWFPIFDIYWSLTDQLSRNSDQKFDPSLVRDLIALDVGLRVYLYRYDNAMNRVLYQRFGLRQSSSQCFSREKLLQQLRFASIAKISFAIVHAEWVRAVTRWSPGINDYARPHWIEYQRYIDTHFKRFVSLVIMEERIKGNIEAFEGILIVKERKRDDTQGLAE